MDLWWLLGALAASILIGLWARWLWPRGHKGTVVLEAESFTSEREIPWPEPSYSFSPSQDLVSLIGKNSLEASKHPEDFMWRPPPRESLLNRQSHRMKPTGHADRSEHPEFIHKPVATPRPPAQRPESETPLEWASSPAPSDQKLGRRQGLESLVNLKPKT